jgi:small subunit ribosomal protein S13
MLKDAARKNRRRRWIALVMPHILGKFLPDHKPVRYALLRFGGIGQYTAAQICARLQFHETLKMGQMSERQLNALSHEVGELKLENDLVRAVRDNIARLRRIGSYRGKRHAAGLPVRGQHTRNNASTARKYNRVDRGYHTLARRPYVLKSMTVDNRAVTASPLVQHGWAGMFGRIRSVLRAIHL